MTIGAFANVYNSDVVGQVSTKKIIIEDRKKSTMNQKGTNRHRISSGLICRRDRTLVI